ncbi:alpha/beta hydrolase family protein [Isoptericola sp. NPDC055881]
MQTIAVRNADLVLQHLDRGDARRAQALFDPAVRRRLPARRLGHAWRQAVSVHGGLTAWQLDSVAVPEEPGAPTVVRLACRTPGPALTAVVTVAPDGGLLDLQVRPTVLAWEPPTYADVEELDEVETVMGAGDTAVGGTLTIPHGNGTVPAVVLLSGMGPFDRDMTTGSNRIGRDLAWGLATRGIAVARYDNPSHGAPERATRPGAVAMDDYRPVPDAVRQLGQHPRVDAARITLAGHSMGGKIAPRVAALLDDDRRASLGGLILLAADAAPMPEAAVRVVKHLATHPGTGVDRRDVRRTVRQARRAAGPRLRQSTPTSRLPFGLPASFWLDLRRYDPVATARQSGLPLLLLQGCRDYQVTVEDDLALWRQGLADHPHVTIREVPEDDHFFLPGTGPSLPRDYEQPGHLDQQVVDAIADWIHAH